MGQSMLARQLPTLLQANLGSLDEARAEIEQLRSDLEGLDSRHSTSNESTREKQRTELATLQQQNSDLKAGCRSSSSQFALLPLLAFPVDVIRSS